MWKNTLMLLLLPCFMPLLQAQYRVIPVHRGDTLTARLWRYETDSSGNKYKETYYPATASFNVLAAGSTSSKSPKTGDESNVALWASVLVLSGGAVIALIPKKKSRAR